MAGALRENLHCRILAQIDAESHDSPSVGDVSIVELKRRQRAKERQVEIKRQERATRKQLQKDSDEAAAVANKATIYLENLAKLNCNEVAKQATRYEEELAEVDLKTKRFFDVVDKRKGTTRTNGAMYYGDFIEIDKALDWIPHGYGEIRLPSGETIYEGEFAHGMRHGHGTVPFPDGGQWKGSFYKDEARGLGIYTWCKLQDGRPELQPRRAIYHNEGRSAWLDDLIPGRRVVVYRLPHEVYGNTGTIVEKVRVGQANLIEKPVYVIHFDESGRLEAVNLAEHRFDVLHHQALFHRIESAQKVELQQREYSHDSHGNFSQNENLFRPEAEVSKAETLQARYAMRRRWEQRLARNAATQAKKDDKTEIARALAKQRQCASAYASEEAALQQKVSIEIAAKKSARLRQISELSRRP